MRDAMNNHKITLFTSDNLHFKTKPCRAPVLSCSHFFQVVACQGRERRFLPRAPLALLAPLTRPKSPFSSLFERFARGLSSACLFISTCARKIRAVTKAVPVWAFVHTWKHTSYLHVGHYFCSGSGRGRRSIPNKGIGYKFFTSR